MIDNMVLMERSNFGENILKKIKLVMVVSLLLAPVVQAQVCYSGMTKVAPDSRFEINANATVLDKNTGLIWKQCTEGMSGINCSTNENLKFSWPATFLHVENLNAGGGFAGYTDWRVPSVIELASILEVACSKPQINIVAFPNTQISTHWTSTPVFSNVTLAWGVTFNGGTTNTGDRTSTTATPRWLRLVRGN